MSARRPDQTIQNSLLLILQPHNLVAETNELPDDRLHRVRQAVLLPRRVRVPLRRSTHRGGLVILRLVIAGLVNRCPWAQTRRRRCIGSAGDRCTIDGVGDRAGLGPGFCLRMSSLPRGNALLPFLRCLRETFVGEDFQLLQEGLLSLDEQNRVVSPYRPLDQFLDIEVSIVSEAELAGERTVIVNLLYGKSVGMTLKKLSLYSPSKIALRAILASTGLRTGGNLPLVSQFSVAGVSHTTTRFLATRPTFLNRLPELYKHLLELGVERLLQPLSALQGCCAQHLQSQVHASFAASLRRPASPKTHSRNVARLYA